MSFQDLIELMGRELYQVTRGFYIEDFERAVEALGGIRRRAGWRGHLTTYAMPINKGPYYAVLRTNFYKSMFLIGLGKVDTFLIPLEIPTVDLDSEEGHAARKELVKAVQSLIYYFSPLFPYAPKNSVAKINSANSIKVSGDKRNVYLPPLAPKELPKLGPSVKTEDWLLENAPGHTTDEMLKLGQRDIKKLFGTLRERLQSRDKSVLIEGAVKLKKEGRLGYKDGRWE